MTDAVASGPDEEAPDTSTQDDAPADGTVEDHPDWVDNLKLKAIRDVKEQIEKSRTFLDGSLGHRPRRPQPDRRHRRRGPRQLQDCPGRGDMELRHRRGVSVPDQLRHRLDHRCARCPRRCRDQRREHPEA